MFLEFKQLGASVARTLSPQNDWEWYFVAQHYGLPTRLVDWTLKPLVALFFAVSKIPDPNKMKKPEPLIWILTPRRVNKHNDDTIVPGGPFSQYWLTEWSDKACVKVKKYPGLYNEWSPTDCSR